MTDMASLPASPGNTNSVAGSVKTALGIPNMTVSDDIESSETTFVDFLQGLIQPAPETLDTLSAAETGNGLPLAGQVTDLAAVTGQSLEEQVAEQGDHAELLVAGLLPAKAGSEIPLTSDAAAQTSATLSAQAFTKTMAAGSKLTAGLKTESNSTALPSASALNVSSAVETPEMLAENLPQLRASTITASQMMELSASRQALDTHLQSSTPTGDAFSASLLRSPVPHTALGTDSAMTASTNMPAITESFGRPEWNQGLGKQIMWMVNQNMQSAEIRLNPAHLGPIEVRIEIEDETVNVAFSSRHAAVREAVEMALPRLREMFESSGISLADTDISQHSFAEQRESQLRDETQASSRMFTARSVEDDSPRGENTPKQTDGDRSMIDYYI